MSNKIRADQLLVNLKLANSKEQAKRLILAGQVFYYKNNEKVKVKDRSKDLLADQALCRRT